MVAPPPQNVLQLTASGAVEVQQDLLSMTLTTTRDATDAATVQSQLKTAVDTALAEAKKSSYENPELIHPALERLAVTYPGGKAYTVRREAR